MTFFLVKRNFIGMKYFRKHILLTYFHHKLHNKISKVTNYMFLDMYTYDNVRVFIRFNGIY